MEQMGDKQQMLLQFVIKLVFLIDRLILRLSVVTTHQKWYIETDCVESVENYNKVGNVQVVENIGKTLEPK